MSFYRLLLCSMPLLLTACGDGWEAQRTTEVFPYGNQRTAGSGVVYVRAKMMPEKELVVETPAAAETAPAPAMSADKIFNESQMKGAHTPIATPSASSSVSEGPVPAHAAVDKSAAVVSVPSAQIPTAAVGTGEIVPPPPAVVPATDKAVDGVKQQINGEKHSSAADVLSPAMKDKVKFNMAGAQASVNTAQLLSQGQQHPQELEVAVSTLKSDNVPAARVASASSDKMNGAYEVYPNEVIEPAHSVSMPGNEIVSPKKDFVRGTNEGRRSLNQIYEDSF